MIELSHKPLIRAYRGDCMGLMADAPDDHYGLAIVDPPYGIERFKCGGSLISIYGNPGPWNEAVPQLEYFSELQRISVNQIIYGGNYFNLPLTGSWIFWDKVKNRGSHGNFADGELIWTSFNRPLRKARIPYDGFVGADAVRIHPTQKPIKLYLWLLTNYAKPGQTILDTHGGSFSSAIACHKMGYGMDICELDGEYFEAACERFERETRQQKLF